MRKPESDVILTRMMALHPKLIDLTLDRVWRLLAALDHPERALPPVIHVAGTNGKGSTVAMLRAGLEAAGGRVHAYTSPHLVRFHERIRLAGGLISESRLTEVLDECERANDGIPITYFEITTVAALLAFARTPADWCLLEVGLGGRLDATNVVERPALTVITPVSFDHQQFLGETLAEIAAEKAGILKPGVPCVVAPQRPEAMATIEARAAELGAPLIRAGAEWQVRAEQGGMRFEDAQGTLFLPPPRLLGAHQIDNAGTAVAALRALKANDAACTAAVADAEWPGRMQRLTRGPLAAAAPGVELWLDGGHNEAAGMALASHLAGLPERPTWLIMGMLATKDPDAFLAPFPGRVRGIRMVTIPDEDAAATAADLTAAARAAGLPAEPAASPAAALADIAAQEPTARVLICGSLYLAGQILRENG